MNLLKISRKLAVKDTDSLESAIEFMIKHSISGVAVVNDSGRLVGVLSTKDFLNSLLSFKYHNTQMSTVSKYMVESPETVNVNSSIHKLIDIFTEKTFHYYPVIDNLGIFVGMVYRKDLLREIMDFKESTW